MELKKLVKTQIKDKFKNWLDTFIEEKGIDIDESFIIENNLFNYAYIIDCIKSTSKNEQNKIKDILVKIDFVNGDIKDYFRYLAKALVVRW